MGGMSWQARTLFCALATVTTAAPVRMPKRAMALSTLHACLYRAIALLHWTELWAGVDSLDQAFNARLASEWTHSIAQLLPCHCLAKFTLLKLFVVSHASNIIQYYACVRWRLILDNVPDWQMSAVLSHTRRFRVLLQLHGPCLKGDKWI